MINDVLWGMERKKIMAVIILEMSEALILLIMTCFWPFFRTDMV